MKMGTMHQGICKNCGGTFWESSPGARGEDICDTCKRYDDLMATYVEAGRAAAQRGEPISNAPFVSNPGVGPAWRKGWLSVRKGA